VEAIAHFRACLLDTTQTETEKMQESVSWAKFGTNSLKVGGIREGRREGGSRTRGGRNEYFDAFWGRSSRDFV